MRILQVALLLAVGLIASGCQFENHAATFDGCRQKWIERFNPKIGLAFDPQLVEYEYMSSCMGAKGFKLAKGCYDKKMLSSSECFQRRMPWE